MEHLNGQMKLNLDLVQNNDLVSGDQTPTPTSFFKNCEAVGLFQDLQNVNPFEETFQKALDNPEEKYANSSSATNEDTLHTPHVLPILPEEQLIPNVVENNSVPSITSIIHIQQDISKNRIVISNVNSLEEKQNDLRCVVREALLKKNSHLKNNTKTIIPQKKNSTNKQNSDKVREINRAAQVRFRMRRKNFYDEKMKELDMLRSENNLLKKENVLLKQSVGNMKVLLKEVGKSNEAERLDALKNFNLGKFIDKKAESEDGILKKLPLLAPAISPSLKNSQIHSLIYKVIPMQNLNSDS